MIKCNWHEYVGQLGTIKEETYLNPKVVKCRADEKHYGKFVIKLVLEMRGEKTGTGTRNMWLRMRHHSSWCDDSNFP